MATAVLLLAAVVAWMLYRRQSEDGTLPDGLTIRGATVSVANVDAVERRKIWQFQGVSKHQALNQSILVGDTWAWQNTGLRMEYVPVNGLVIHAMQWVSHRPNRQLLVDRPPNGTWSKAAWNNALMDFDSWWVPRMVTLREAQQMDVIELPPNLRES
jgi:hypothetical protein